MNDHRRWIPSEFDLQITDITLDNYNTVNASINMKTFYKQHARIFTAHYWRYHVKTIGKISVGSTTETLDEKPQIIEFLSFKSQGRRR